MHKIQSIRIDTKRSREPIYAYKVFHTHHQYDRIFRTLQEARAYALFTG